MAFGVAMTLLGFPAQIRKNRKEGKSGQPLLMVWLPLGVFVSRVAYASTIGASWMLVPDILGALMCLILLGQWFKYR